VLKAYEVFSDVTGGRPPYFSRLIRGGNRSPLSIGGNAEGASLPRR